MKRPSGWCAAIDHPLIERHSPCPTTTSFRLQRATTFVGEELSPHDRPSRGGSRGTDEGGVDEQRLPPVEGICRSRIVAAARPSFDRHRPGDGRLLDCGPQQQSGQPAAAEVGTNNEARHQPHCPVIVRWLIAHHLPAVRRGKIPLAWAAGTPANRLSCHRCDDAHRVRTACRQRFEPATISGRQPTTGEVESGRTWRHAPTAAGVAVPGEQLSHLAKLGFPHRACHDVCQSHARPYPHLAADEASAV